MEDLCKPCRQPASQPDRQPDSQTASQTDRQTARQTDSHGPRQMKGQTTDLIQAGLVEQRERLRLRLYDLAPQIHLVRHLPVLLLPLSDDGSERRVRPLHLPLRLAVSAVLYIQMCVCVCIIDR